MEKTAICFAELLPCAFYPAHVHVHAGSMLNIDDLGGSSVSHGESEEEEEEEEEENEKDDAGSCGRGRGMHVSVPVFLCMECTKRQSTAHSSCTNISRKHFQRPRTATGNSSESGEDDVDEEEQVQAAIHVAPGVHLCELCQVPKPSW
jgi:acetoin utilization deacetylase AcuC-like enzyme